MRIPWTGNPATLRDSPDRKLRTAQDTLTVGKPVRGKFNEDEERLISIYMAENPSRRTRSHKRNAAVDRLRVIKRLGYTAKDILDQMPLPIGEPR